MSRKSLVITLCHTQPFTSTLGHARQVLANITLLSTCLIAQQARFSLHLSAFLVFCRHVYSLTHAKRLYIFLSFFCWSGTCFVEYDDREAHGKALGLHHSKLCGRVVNVELTVGVRDQSAFSLELKKTPFRLKTCLVVCVNYDECNSILL
jgi:hypothetical protein